MKCNFKRNSFTNDILNWADAVIIEDAVEHREDDHIDVEEHHSEHCAELALVKQIHAGGQNDDSTAGVKQDFQQKNHHHFKVKWSTLWAIPEIMIYISKWTMDMY